MSQDGKAKHQRDEQVHAAREARKQQRIKLYARRGGFSFKTIFDTLSHFTNPI